MFGLFKKEMEDWRCQFGTSNGDKIGLRHVLHRCALSALIHKYNDVFLSGHYSV
jgi:hypothetical protein